MWWRWYAIAAVGGAVAGAVWGLAASDGLWSAVEQHLAYVQGEVLATSLDRVDAGDHTITVDGESVAVTIRS